jgi:uncharacterized membrane protein YgcG
MEVTYASMLSAGPNNSPQQRMAELKRFYDSSSHMAANILREALGIRPTNLPGMPPLAAALLDYTIMVCVDTESWTSNTDEMTEVGLAVIDRRRAREVSISLGYGEHGVNLLRELKFYHLRIKEKAHLKSTKEGCKGAEGNRFGFSRFGTVDEIHDFLDRLFNQPITDKPELIGCKRPVILIGHALEHDEKNVKKKSFSYDFQAHGTVVYKIDTQPLVQELGAWTPPPHSPKNVVSLENLCKDVAKFTHTDPHTACNDAARTMMCAIWLVTPKQHRNNPEDKMEDIASAIEAHSASISITSWGSAFCCTRCGGDDHFNDGTCQVSVKCDACARFLTDKSKWHSHIESYCLGVADLKAWMRRYHDAVRKNRDPEPGPSADSHPESTYVGVWPLPFAVPAPAPASASSTPTSVYCTPDSQAFLPVDTTAKGPVSRRGGRGGGRGSGRGNSRGSGRASGRGSSSGRRGSAAGGRPL